MVGVGKVWVSPEVGDVESLCEQPISELVPLDPPGRELHKSVHLRGYTVDTVCSPGTKRPHAHASLEMMFVHSGASVWRVGTWRRVLVPGDVLVFDARAVHASRPVGGQYVRTTLHFMAGSADRSVAEKLPLNERVPWFVSLSGPAIRRVTAALRALRQRFEAPARSRSEGSLLADIVGEVYDAFALPKQPALHPVVREVIEYMTDHPERSESLSELAARFFVSEGHLCHLFRSHFGCSPLRLWQLIKIEGVCYSLLFKDKPVTELAQEVGFASRRGFQRAFRRVTGMTVETYRSGLAQELTLSS